MIIIEIYNLAKYRLIISRSFFGGNWTLEAVEASEVAEATEVKEAGEVFKAWKITTVDVRDFHVLEFNGFWTLF